MTFAEDVDFEALFQPAVGTLILELAEDLDEEVIELGTTTDAFHFAWSDTTIDLQTLEATDVETLEDIYPTTAENDYTGTPDVAQVTKPTPSYKFAGKVDGAPKAVLAVFPGTNCEYDTAVLPRTLWR